MKDNLIIQWIKNRFSERTTMDGVVLIVSGISYFLFKPVFSIIAVGAILYGIWTILKPS